MAARSLEIGDLLASRLELFLRGHLPGTTVTRTYTPFVDDDAFEAAIGNAKAMLVYVVPMRKTSTLETRGEDIDDYSYRIVFVEKCTEAGLPDNEWMDLRVTTVEAAEEQFGDARNPFETENGQLWAQESEIDLIFDSDSHAENGTFWSVWNLTMREFA